MCRCGTLHEVTAETYYVHPTTGDKVCRVYIRQKRKEYYLRNKQKVIDGNTRYKTTRAKIDVQFRLTERLRTRLRMALKGNAKVGSAIRDLGCTIDELKVYLESKFQPGMMWDNYGIKGWHIDHITPLSRADLTNPEQLKQVLNFKNLQPMWAKDNILKGNK